MVTKISDFLNTTFSTLTLNDAVNNSVVYPGTIVHTTTGTPGAGIGAGLQFQVETSNNNNEYGMTLETLTTDVTAGSEDFDFIVKLMQNGAAAGERLRLNSAGQLTVSAGMVANSFTPNASTVPTNGMYLPSTNNIGFATASTLRLRIDDAGNAGFGVTPIIGGTVSFGTGSSPVLAGDGGYYGGGAYWDSNWKNSVSSQGGWVIRNTSGVFTVWTGSAPGAAGTTFGNFAERMRIDSLGNVGVGTSTIQVGYKLQVEGDFAATSKSFVINHPTKPGMMLRYGSLESPYHGIRLTGEDEVIDGKCKVNLPEYIHALCKQEGAQVQLTNIKHGKSLWIDDIDIANNQFTVKTRGKGKYRFYWSFTAVRKDIEDMLVEFNKE